MISLDRHAIAERLRDIPRANPLNGDFRVGGWPDSATDIQPAAVLVPIVDRSKGMTVLLTQRTDHLHHHPGQVSFPGGRVETKDEHPVATAIRETEEEIGLSRRYLEVAGYLDLYKTVTGFLVTPVVAFVETGFHLALDSFEVAQAFEVPLDFILDPHNYRLESRLVNGAERRYYVIPYEEHTIWGATAAMLVNLSDILQVGSDVSQGVGLSNGAAEKEGGAP